MPEKIVCPKCGKRIIKSSACCWYCGSFDILKLGEPSAYYRASFKTDGVNGPIQTKADLLKEIESFIDEMGDKPQMIIHIAKINMTEAEFEALPEFEGY